jgi:nicotinate dehydrogenase subunit B
VASSGNGKKDDGLSRREFIGLTGGLAVLFSLPGPLRRAAAAEDEGEDVNAWLLIGTDNRVTAFMGKVEIGQGNTTAFMQLVAEELTLPFDAVAMLMGDTDKVPYDDGTWGSTSIRDAGVRIQAAAAAAREILAGMAAEQWGVAREAVTVNDGRVVLTSDSNTSTLLGEVTRGQRIERKLKGDPKLWPVEQHRIVGKPIPRVDSRPVVTGEVKFVGDLRVPGMLYGARCYPPCFGARRTSLDTSAAERVPGVVKVVVEGDFVGVAGESPEAVAEGVNAIKVNWEEPSHPAMETLFDDLRRTAGKPDVASEEGAVEQALASGARVFAATYRAPFAAHAPVEPHAALASWGGKRLTVHSAVQTPFLNREEISAELGLDQANIRVLVPRVGGGFGGKANSDVAVIAARLARGAGRPVLVTLTRPEEFTWNYFKPAALIDLRSAVDASGRIVAWDCGIYNCGDRGAVPPYDLPNHRVRCYPCQSPLREGAWRGLAGIANTFAIESQMDEMARATGQDPVAFRLRHLRDDARQARVVQAVAEAYGWPPKARQAGVGIGFACAPDAGSYTAEIAEVEVDRETGAIQVRRAVIAHESGLIVTTDGIINQIEGAFTMGLGPTLWEQVRYERGRITTDSYATYRIPTIKDVPAIETVLVPNPHHPPQGAGEPALFPVAALVANAVVDAGGPRIRELPLTPDRVKG